MMVEVLRTVMGEQLRPGDCQTGGGGIGPTWVQSTSSIRAKARCDVYKPVHCKLLDVNLVYCKLESAVNKVKIKIMK